MARIDPTIFKAYDIRGIYPTELNEGTAHRIGQSFAAMLVEKRPGQSLTVAVGRDTRLSSPQLHDALVKGILAGGVSIDDLGFVPSELVSFAVGKYGYDGGVVVTASHNPKEYNGIRMVDHQVVMQSGKALFQWMTEHPNHRPAHSPGALTGKKLVSEYIEHALTFIDSSKLKPLTVIVDAGNGMASVTISELFQRIPGQLIQLNFDLDGNFPNRPSNPLLPESQSATIERVKAEGADLGVIFDGDADRILFVTELGEVLRGDTSLLILAHALLAHEPGAAISYNVVCSKIVAEKIAEWGGRPIRTPVGLINVSKPLREEHAVMGGEPAAHYCYRDNYAVDSGLISFVLMLEILSTSGQPLSKLSAGLNPYSRAETFFTTDRIPALMAELKETYVHTDHDELDGLTVRFPDWWMNVRPSNTEPLLRLTIEGNTPDILKRELSRLTSFFIERGAHPERML